MRLQIKIHWSRDKQNDTTSGAVLRARRASLAPLVNYNQNASFQNKCNARARRVTPPHPNNNNRRAARLHLRRRPITNHGGTAGGAARRPKPRGTRRAPRPPRFAAVPLSVPPFFFVFFVVYFVREHEREQRRCAGAAAVHLSTKIFTK